MKPMRLLIALLLLVIAFSSSCTRLTGDRVGPTSLGKPLPISGTPVQGLIKVGAVFLHAKPESESHGAWYDRAIIEDSHSHTLFVFSSIEMPAIPKMGDDIAVHGKTALDGVATINPNELSFEGDKFVNVVAGRNPFPDNGGANSWIDMQAKGSIALWHLRSDALDTSGNGHNGTAVDLTFSAFGAFFNGGTSSFFVEDHPQFQFSNRPFAISLWFFTDGAPRSTIQPLFTKRKTINPFPQVSLYLGDGTCGTPQAGASLTAFWMSDGGRSHCDQSPPVSSGWHHLALRSEGKDGGYLFLDSVFIAESHFSVAETYDIAGFPIALGSIPGTQVSLNGMLSEVAIFTTLSDADVVAIYNNQK